MRLSLDSSQICFKISTLIEVERKSGSKPT
jgi:hypothetical protein